jgi:hypothetical protein
MGDRCYLSITIHGHIETVAVLNDVVIALEAEGMSNDVFEGNLDSEFIGAIERSSNPAFHLDECNYADIGGLETALQAHAIPYYVSHDEGGDYPAGCWSWSKETGKTDAIRAQGLGACIAVTAIETALKAENPLTEFAAIVARANAAEGVGLPYFTVSDAVRSHLGVAPLATEEPA